MKDMTREELMGKIRELQFAAVELNLFLDNHPENKQALSDYNKISEDLCELKKMYEEKCGPLTNYGYAPSQYPWQWVNEPWPWERMD